MNDQNLLSLEKLACKDSGLQELLELKQKDNRYEYYLGLLLCGKFTELNAKFLERPDYVNSTDFKALQIISFIMQGKTIKRSQISLFNRFESFLDHIAFELIELYAKLYENTNGVITEIFNFYSLKEFLPAIHIYFSEFVLNHQLKDFYAEMVTLLEDPANFNFENQNLKAQQFRLLAYYHQRDQNRLAAEKYLVEYREHFTYKRNTRRQIKGLKIDNLSQFYLTNDYKWLYEEINKLEHELEDRNMIYKETCFYFKCSDCCHRDYPTTSEGEMDYLVKYLEENNIDYSESLKSAKEIQESHQEKFGFKMPIVEALEKTKYMHNPKDEKFKCPFLVAEMCIVHQHRPYNCRAYGMSTNNMTNTQSCNFYLKQFQLNANHLDIRYSYDTKPILALIKASNLKKYGANRTGTIATWLADSKYSKI
jgi:Fe-S-cluster containining protein